MLFLYIRIDICNCASHNCMNW